MCFFSLFFFVFQALSLFQPIHFWSMFLFNFFQLNFNFWFFRQVSHSFFLGVFYIITKIIISVSYIINSFLISSRDSTRPLLSCSTAPYLFSMLLIQDLIWEISSLRFWFSPWVCWRRKCSGGEGVVRVPFKFFCTVFFKVMYAAKGVTLMAKFIFESCISLRIDANVALAAISNSVTEPFSISCWSVCTSLLALKISKLFLQEIYVIVQLG